MSASKAAPVINRSGVIDPADATVELRELLCLDESATQDFLIIAAAQRIRSMQRSEHLRQASERVQRAFSNGKLAESQREWAIGLAERDPAEFDRWVATAPQLVPLGRTVGPASRSDEALRSIEQAARSEFRTHRELLEGLCTEQAYVAAAVRDHNRAGQSS